MYSQKDNREGPGPKSVLLILILAILTVAISLYSTLLVSSRIVNLPTTTTTAVIALETFIAQTETSTPSSPLTSTPSITNLQIIEKSYTIVRGDTFDKISESLFGATKYANAIQKSNCIDTIQRDQEIRIKYYIIQNGDDIFEIADRLNINYQRLRFINTDQSEFVIYPGQYLILPVSNICS
ncbi:MAG: LysM peptidoglycan-binding domain-containing protein [Anaerolineales bacterium]|nr:LysM peptidoglycan-binding domain-containing protein [Anaerolineales bacterium]